MNIGYWKRPQGIRNFGEIAHFAERKIRNDIENALYERARQVISDIISCPARQ